MQQQVDLVVHVQQIWIYRVGHLIRNIEKYLRSSSFIK